MGASGVEGGREGVMTEEHERGKLLVENNQGLNVISKCST